MDGDIVDERIYIAEASLEQGLRSTATFNQVTWDGVCSIEIEFKTDKICTGTCKSNKP